MGRLSIRCRTGAPVWLRSRDEKASGGPASTGVIQPAPRPASQLRLCDAHHSTRCGTHRTAAPTHQLSHCARQPVSHKGLRVSSAETLAAAASPITPRPSRDPRGRRKARTARPARRRAGPAGYRRRDLDLTCQQGLSGPGLTGGTTRGDRGSRYERHGIALHPAGVSGAGVERKKSIPPFY